MKQGFLYLFDLLDFDDNGQVTETKEVDLNHARSNFLYLVSKYNQNLLKQDEGQTLPIFFKEELASLLESVENGGDYLQAKNAVFENCLPQVKAMKNEKESDVIENLNRMAVFQDAKFIEDMKKITVVNDLQHQYIITNISGKLFSKIMKGKEDFKQNKSALFKAVINYNSLVSALDKTNVETVERKNNFFSLPSKSFDFSASV